MRNAQTARDKSDICEEIADVLIMCIQMSKIFGEERVKQMFEDKLIRLKERLDHE